MRGGVILAVFVTVAKRLARVTGAYHARHLMDGGTPKLAKSNRWIGR